MLECGTRSPPHGAAPMDQSLQVLWGDGERVLFRGSRLGAEGERRPVLAVLLAADRPPPLALERLAHEYELRKELDGAWGARPLEFVREDRARHAGARGPRRRTARTPARPADGDRRLLAPRDRR